MTHWKDDLPDWYVKKYGRQPCINIGTAGHVDHGKTTLVQSLTGVWTSTHSQELKRGITIRVGYSDVAFYKCPKCSEPEGYSTESKCANCGKKSELTRVVSIVDSPGHESLMANMLSGAALMDGGILVIGADQKVPQLQTEEHLLALQILGIKQLVVVQNKIDLLTYEEAIANHSAMEKFMKKFKIKAPIVPVSAQSGLNKDALVGLIESEIKTPERDPCEPSPPVRDGSNFVPMATSPPGRMLSTKPAPVPSESIVVVIELYVFFLPVCTPGFISISNFEDSCGKRATYNTAFYFWYVCARFVYIKGA